LTLYYFYKASKNSQQQQMEVLAEALK